MLETFISQEAGTVVSFDKVPANAGQSVQLIAKWCQFIGLPFQWANPSDWWDGFDENFLEYWDKVEMAEGMSLTAIHPGDIVIFDSQLPGSDGAGHASIFLGLLDERSWQGFDANWGGKSAHTVCHSWAYVRGWYTPKNPSVVEAPTPTPIAEEVSSEPFDADIIEAKIVRITQPDAKLYNLKNTNWDSFNQNPINTVPAGTEIAVTAVAQHRLGGSYYMPDIERPEGYRMEDCEDYDATPSVGRTISIRTTPLPPEPTVSRTIIAPPFLAPSTTDTIQVLFPIPKYSKMSDALRGTGSSGQLRPDRYFVYKRLNGVINITPRLGEPVGIWINPADLQPKPEPVPPALPPAPEPAAEVTFPNWRATYHPFRDADGEVAPRYFIALTRDKVVDFEHGHEAYILHRQPVLITGWFTGPDGQEYGRPHDASIRFLWYGVRRDNLKPEQEEINMLDEDEPIVLFAGVRAKIATVLQNPSRVFDIIKPKH